MSRELDIRRALKYLRRAIAERRPTGFSHIEADSLNRNISQAVSLVRESLEMFDRGKERNRNGKD